VALSSVEPVTEGQISPARRWAITFSVMMVTVTQVLGFERDQESSHERSAPSTGRIGVHAGRLQRDEAQAAESRSTG
jgi:RPA family protein